MKYVFDMILIGAVCWLGYVLYKAVTIYIRLKRYRRINLP